MYNIFGWPANAQPVNSNDCKQNIDNIDKEKILFIYKTYGQGSGLISSTV